MKEYTLEETTILPISIEQAWTFFSNPMNLPVITPPALDFKVLSRPPEKIHSGLRLDYTVTPLLGIRMRWTSEITEVVHLRTFTDVQIRGPYQAWIHRHTFEESAGGVKMKDLVRYQLALDPLSRPAHALLVRPQLEAIFNFRRKKLGELFATGRKD